MSRRRQAVKRPLMEDSKFQSTLVSRLVSTVMDCGKKSLAQRIVYSAFDEIAGKNPNANPLEILQRAVDNVRPRLEVKARRVGGATYQVPLEVPGDRQLSLAMRWLVDLADARKGIPIDRKSTRLNSSHGYISYAVFCLKKKKKQRAQHRI